MNEELWYDEVKKRYAFFFQNREKSKMRIRDQIKIVSLAIRGFQRIQKKKAKAIFDYECGEIDIRSYVSSRETSPKQQIVSLIVTLEEKKNTKQIPRGKLAKMISSTQSEWKFLPGSLFSPNLTHEEKSAQYYFEFCIPEREEFTEKENQQLLYLFYCAFQSFAQEETNQSEEPEKIWKKTTKTFDQELKEHLFPFSQIPCSISICIKKSTKRSIIFYVEVKRSISKKTDILIPWFIKIEKMGDMDIKNCIFMRDHNDPLAHPAGYDIEFIRLEVSYESQPGHVSRKQKRKELLEEINFLYKTLYRYLLDLEVSLLARKDQENLPGFIEFFELLFAYKLATPFSYKHNNMIVDCQKIFLYNITDCDPISYSDPESIWDFYLMFQNIVRKPFPARSATVFQEECSKRKTAMLAVRCMQHVDTTPLKDLFERGQKIDNMFFCTLPLPDAIVFCIFLRQDSFYKKDGMHKLILNAKKKIDDTFSQRKILNINCSNLFNIEENIDPKYAGECYTEPFIDLLYEGLLRMEGEEIVPALAESYEVSEDGLSYLFHLRKELKWSNGSPITAKDFLRSWITILTPEIDSPYAYAYFPIKNAKKIYYKEAEIESIGVEILDKHTIKIHLEYPYVPFLELLTHPMYRFISRSVPYGQDIFALIGKDFERFYSGPFILTNNGNPAILLTNPEYWNKKAIGIDQVNIFNIEDTKKQCPIFESNAVDWVGAPFSPIYEKIPDHLQHELKYSKQEHVSWLMLNTNEFPLNNVHIRQALAFAINRERFIKEHFIYKKLFPAVSIQTDSLKLYEEKRLIQGDLKLAKKLFEKGCRELDISPEKFPKLQILTGKMDLTKSVIKKIAEEWHRQLGIQTRICSRAWKDGTAKVLQEKKKIFIHHVYWYSWIQDPIYTLECFAELHHPMNTCRWFSRSYRHSIQSSYFAQNEEERMSHLKNAEQILLQEFPIIPLFWGYEPNLEKPYVHGIKISPNRRISLSNARIDLHNPE